MSNPYERHLEQVRRRYWKKQSDKKWVESEKIRKRLSYRKRREQNIEKFRERDRKYAKRKRKSYFIPEHNEARRVFNYAVKKGWIEKPKVCPSCKSNKNRIEAHHSDYSKPFQVDWRCSQCHGKLHRIQ